jgi:hypothetical protein
MNKPRTAAAWLQRGGPRNSSNGWSGKTVYIPTNPDRLRLKDQALVITHDYGRWTGIDLILKDGALDRVLGNSVDSDPVGLSCPNVANIPSCRKDADPIVRTLANDQIRNWAGRATC